MGNCCKPPTLRKHNSFMVEDSGGLFYPLVSEDEAKARPLDSLPYFHYLPNFSQDLFLYNFSKKSMVIFKLEGSLNSINYGVLQHKTQLFIGGGCSIKTFKNDFIGIDLQRAGNVEAKEHMLHKKCNHRYVATQEGYQEYIYSIGGMDENSSLRQVERYDINRDVWEEAPQLTEGKHLVGACCFRDRNLYVFGGYNNTVPGVLGTIEFLDLNLYQRWRKVFLTPETSNLWSPRLNSGCIQVSYEYILIFGGFDGVEAMSDTLLFHVASRQVHRSRRMDSPGIFPVNLTPPIFFEKLIYAFSVKPMRNLHCYDISQSYWSTVPPNEWLESSAGS